MPIYEYECSKCGRVSEIFQKMTEKPLNKCPDCSGKVHRLISQSAFHLKGSGWYVTDYAGKGKKEASDSTKTKDASSAPDSKKTEKTTSPKTE